MVVGPRVDQPGWMDGLICADGSWRPDPPPMHSMCLRRLALKRDCIEFKYYADGIHSSLTPPGNIIADPPGLQKLNYRRVYAHHYCRAL